MGIPVASRVAPDARRALVVALLSVVAFAAAGASGAVVVVVAALALVAAAAVVAPVGVLCAALFALPWFFHPLVVGGQRVAASEIALVLAAAGTAGAALRAHRRDLPAFAGWLVDRVRDCVRSRLVLAAGALALVGLLLALRPYDAAHRAESLREWRWVLAEPVLLLVLLVVHQRARDLRWLVAGALLTGIAAAALVGAGDILLDRGVSVEGVTRISGPYPHPNALALMVARGVALGVALFALAPHSRPLVVPLTLVSGVALVATFSRGAMLAAAVAVLFVLPALPVRQRLVAVGGGAAALLALVVAARDRMLDAFGGGSGTLRLEVWESAARMIAARPLWGYGPDQFLYAYLPRYVSPAAWEERFTAHAHNLVLDSWVRLGIIGGAFSLAALALVAWAAARAVRRPSGSDALASAAAIALAASLAHGLIDNAYFAHDLALSGWLLAWLALEREPVARGSD